MIISSRFQAINWRIAWETHFCTRACIQTTDCVFVRVMVAAIEAGQNTQKDPHWADRQCQLFFLYLTFNRMGESSLEDGIARKHTSLMSSSPKLVNKFGRIMGCKSAKGQHKQHKHTHFALCSPAPLRRHVSRTKELEDEDEDSTKSYGMTHCHGHLNMSKDSTDKRTCL